MIQANKKATKRGTVLQQFPFFLFLQKMDNN